MLFRRCAWSESEATRQELREVMEKRRWKLERREKNARGWMAKDCEVR